jgi:hypothetical protein
MLPVTDTIEAGRRLEQINNSIIDEFISELTHLLAKSGPPDFHDIPRTPMAA